MTVLVTGGAGYIGAHVVQMLRARNEQVVIVDDLSNGIADRVPGVPLLRSDLASAEHTQDLVGFMDDHSVDAVIHFAAKKQVGESVSLPAWYYQQNIAGLANLLIAMRAASLRDIVFSSSAAVYGETDVDLITEDYRTAPVNPYGETKLIGEQLLANEANAGNVSAISLRYFNVAGAASPELGDRAALNLVPMVFEKLDEDRAPVIFGNDYATPDGTCIRDYIHVADLAEAHIAALDSLRTWSAPGHRPYNVGTGTGNSVAEIISLILEVSGLDYTPTIAPRRPGDPARIVADPSRASTELGWTAKLTVRDIIESAWASHLQLAARPSKA